SGGRVYLGGWLDGGETIGLEGSGLLLENGTIHFSAGSNAAGSPLLARPVIDASRPGETVAFVSAPTAFAGSVAAALRSRLWGAEANGVGRLVQRPGLELDLIGGFRYLGLEEKLAVSQTRTTLLPEGFTGFFGDVISGEGVGVTIRDHFGTHNEF